MSRGWENLRKLDLEKRQRALREQFAPDPSEWDAIGGNAAGPARLTELADLMVESAVGFLPVPLGVATGFLIDGQPLSIPMAVEEPSVIAAATLAARLLRLAGGLSTRATAPVMTAQVFLEGVPAGREEKIQAREAEIGREVDRLHPAMQERGGGFRGLAVSRLPAGEDGGPAVLRVDLRIDVRDAMGANVLNTAAEGAREILEKISSGRTLMAILSNAAAERRASARFHLPFAGLAAAAPPGWDGAEVARRIAAAARVAEADPARAVTHNKGIMNGISALALATMNDTRAVEAAAHAWAARDGRYRPLSRFRVLEGGLEGELELPLALGTVGGAVSIHPAARLALKILGGPDSARLCRIAAALGLAQNLAALLALVTGGIQRGHMRYHAARLAWAAGARGPEVRQVAEIMARGSAFTSAEAARVLAELRGERR